MILNVNLPKLPDYVLEEKFGRESIRKRIDYYSNGIILTEEDLQEKIQLWIEYIQKVVPPSKVNIDFSCIIEPSSQDQAIRNKQAFLNYFLLVQKNPPEDALKRLDARIALGDKDDSVLKIYVLTADWIIKDQDGDDVIIASLDLRFENGVEESAVWTYDVNGDNQDVEHIYSWKEGLSLYAKFGKEWLLKYAPLNVVPIVPSSH